MKNQWINSVFNLFGVILLEISKSMFIELPKCLFLYEKLIFNLYLGKEALHNF